MKLRFSIWFTIILLSAFAVGYFAWSRSTFNWPFDDTFYPYPEISNHSPSTSLWTTDEYVGWKTYRSEEYGFKFRYPVYWEVQESSTEPSAFRPELIKTWPFYISMDVNFSLLLYRIPPEYSPSQWLDTYVRRLEPNRAIVQSEVKVTSIITEAGARGTELSYGHLGTSRETLFQVGDDLFVGLYIWIGGPLLKDEFERQSESYEIVRDSFQFEK